MFYFDSQVGVCRVIVYLTFYIKEKWDICQLVWLTKNTSYENVGGIFLRKNTIDS